VIIDAVVRHAAAQYGWLTKQMRIRPRVGEFTASEIDILRWAAMGKTNPEIAEILGMTDRNVNTVLIRLTERLSALNKGHTVIKAIELGLFSYA
jgi:DNA-binding CsgD family transcriptional regulator